MATCRERATLSVLFVICLFVILVTSYFAFDGRILVLIESVPGHCSLLTFLITKTNNYVKWARANLWKRDTFQIDLINLMFICKTYLTVIATTTYFNMCKSSLL